MPCARRSPRNPMESDERKMCVHCSCGGGVCKGCRTAAFDEVEAYLRGVRDHAAKRVHKDASDLDVRQKARLETAMRAIEWVRAARSNRK